MENTEFSRTAKGKALVKQEIDIAMEALSQATEFLEDFKDLINSVNAFSSSYDNQSKWADLVMEQYAHFMKTNPYLFPLLDRLLSLMQARIKR